MREAAIAVTTTWMGSAFQAGRSFGNAEAVVEDQILSAASPATEPEVSRRLVDAAVAILNARTMETLLERVAEHAQTITGYAARCSLSPRGQSASSTAGWVVPLLDAEGAPVGRLELSGAGGQLDPSREAALGHLQRMGGAAVQAMRGRSLVGEESEPGRHGPSGEPARVLADATTSVTAELFGALSLGERAPSESLELLRRYGALLDQAFHRRVYREPADSISVELRAIAERLGELLASARDVAELHAQALKTRTRALTPAKARAYVDEGGLLALELMGHLVSIYRRHARAAAGGASSSRPRVGPP